MATGGTQTASVHCNDNHLKHLNFSAPTGVEREGQTKRHCTVQQDKETVLRGISDRGEFAGMFEWENNLIPSPGCVLTST